MQHIPCTNGIYTPLHLLCVYYGDGLSLYMLICSAVVHQHIHIYIYNPILVGGKVQRPCKVQRERAPGSGGGSHQDIFRLPMYHHISPHHLLISYIYIYIYMIDHMYAARLCVCHLNVGISERQRSSGVHCAL